MVESQSIILHNLGYSTTYMVNYGKTLFLYTNYLIFKIKNVKIEK